jgi:hypothetical protein
MEDDLNFLINGRRPQFFNKMEDDLISFSKMETTSIVNKMEDNLNCLQNGRRHQFLGRMEDDLSFF